MEIQDVVKACDTVIALQKNAELIFNEVESNDRELHKYSPIHYSNNDFDGLTINELGELHINFSSFLAEDSLKVTPEELFYVEVYLSKIRKKHKATLAEYEKENIRKIKEQEKDDYNLYLKLKKRFEKD